MSIAFINGQFQALSEIKISPMDRGFLFGEGIYEVIPFVNGYLVALTRHLQRLRNGLAELQIDINLSDDDFKSTMLQMAKNNSAASGSIYIQVTRGVTQIRAHGFPQEYTPTIFMMMQSCETESTLEYGALKGVKAVSQQDRRWRNCHIKSTSLLGNVLHYQHAIDSGADETILYDEQNMVTEGSTSNVFLLKGNTVYTCPLGTDILPGITRQILMDVIVNETQLELVEKPVAIADIGKADEVWISSSSRGVAPVVEIDGITVADGKIGKWAKTISSLYLQNLANYG